MHQGCIWFDVIIKRVALLELHTLEHINVMTDVPICWSDAEAARPCDRWSSVTVGDVDAAIEGFVAALTTVLSKHAKPACKETYVGQVDWHYAACF